MVSGSYHISILLLGVAVPNRSQSLFHQRHRLVLGMVQRGVHFRHLWGGRLVLAAHICKVLQPGCPRLAGQSPFCSSSNLSGSLDQLCSSPSLLGLFITIWTPGVSLGRPPGHGWPSRLTLCLLYSIDSPGPNLNVSLGFESFDFIAWRDWTCSHANVDISTLYEWNIERERTRLLS